MDERVLDSSQPDQHRGSSECPLPTADPSDRPEDRPRRRRRGRRERRLVELKQLAEEQGSVTPQEIADVLNVDELPVDAGVEWDVGRN
jgi:hypothetical protein